MPRGGANILRSSAAFPSVKRFHTHAEHVLTPHERHDWKEKVKKERAAGEVRMFFQVCLYTILCIMVIKIEEKVRTVRKVHVTMSFKGNIEMGEPVNLNDLTSCLLFIY